MEPSTINKERPNLKPRLFWDQRYEDIDWQEGSRGVIERVLVWGNDEEYEEIIRFYGRERIIHVLTKEYCYIPKYMMDHVAGYFGSNQEDFTIYKRRLVKKSTWI
jgi:hypothetical protein